MKHWWIVVLAACDSGAKPAGPPPLPADHELHTITTAESGGEHIQVIGRGVEIRDLHLPAGLLLPLIGRFDFDVDLHVPDDDFRRAIGDAKVTCVAGCAITMELVGGPPPKPIDQLEAHAVIAHGVADLTTWSFAAKDLDVQLAAHVVLARALADSMLSGCAHASPKPPGRPTPEIVSLLAGANVAIDDKGTMSIKLAGPLSAIAPVGYGCEGQSPPAPAEDGVPRPVSDVPFAVKKLTATTFEIERDVLEAAFANPMAAARSVRLVPAVKDGVPQGLKIYAIKPSSMFAQLGFENGDTVMSINGQPLDTADHVLTIYGSLRTAKTLVVALERKGAPLTFTYTVK